MKVPSKLDTVYFTIGPKRVGKLDDEIPRNYFCRWTVLLDQEKTYKMMIARSHVYEDIEFDITVGDRVEIARNSDLYSTEFQVEPRS